MASLQQQSYLCTCDVTILEAQLSQKGRARLCVVGNFAYLTLCDGAKRTEHTLFAK